MLCVLSGCGLCLWRWLRYWDYTVSNWTFGDVCVFVSGSLIFSMMLILSSSLIRALVRHGWLYSVSSGRSTNRLASLFVSKFLPSKSEFKNNSNKQPINNERMTWFQAQICVTKACDFRYNVASVCSLQHSLQRSLTDQDPGSDNRWQYDVNSNFHMGADEQEYRGLEELITNNALKIVKLCLTSLVPLGRFVHFIRPNVTIYKWRMMAGVFQHLICISTQRKHFSQPWRSWNLK